MLRHARKIFLIALLLTQSALSLASSISPLDTRITLVSNGGYPADFLHIAPASASGISINRFSEFSVTGKPLNILSPSAVGTTPTTIVIIADYISLSDTIEIVGDAADIVFISPKRSGAIGCINCTIKNTFRVTLAVTNGEPNFTSPTLGEFNSGGQIALDNFMAPGALNVDILAERVTTKGVLSLHQAVKKDANGGYVADENGPMSMGSGALQLLGGSIRWDYGTQTLVGYTPNSAINTIISGNLRAIDVNIVGAAGMDVDANIDTRTDALASVRYRGNVKISQESVQINDFSEVAPRLDNVIVRSNGRVAIDSVNALTIPRSVHVNGHDVILIAQYELNHLGQISGNTLSLAASKLLNEGWLTANDKLEIFADKWIINRSGGQISANAVHLETDEDFDSFVLNGSRTPYAQIPNSLLDIDENYFNNIDQTKIGTYYTAGLHEKSTFGFTKPSQTSAHILARNIYIQTQAFENINPYYEFVEELGEELVVDRTLLSQVSVIAEDKLKIKAARYILNSSALLGAERPNSEVLLDSKVLSNERYRVLAMLDLDYYSTTGDFIDTGSWKNGEPIEYQDTTTIEKVRTKMATFSPPGVLYSMGSFQFSSDTTQQDPKGLFLNIIGYFEVFGEAVFNTASVIDAGLENQQITRNESVRNYSYGVRNSVSTNDYIADPQEIDSLFYVGGDARATQTDTSRFLNLNPFKGYLRVMLDRLMENYAFVGDYETISLPGSANEIDRSHSLSTSLNFGIETDLVDLPDDFTISWYENINYFPYRPGEMVEDISITSSGTDTYSIFDELKNLFESLVDSFIETFNELKWW